MKANDKVITTIYCLIFIIGLVCNVSGLGYFNFKHSGVLLTDGRRIVLLPHAESGPNYHQEDAPDFIKGIRKFIQK